MTPMEAALLAYLQRYAGHVCTRADLLRHVWDYDPALVATRTVDTTVCGCASICPPAPASSHCVALATGTLRPGA